MPRNDLNGREICPREDLEQLYPVPDHTRAQQMLERHRQVDLRDTAFTALYYEAYRLITRLQHDRTPGPWLFDPLHAVLRALRRAR